MVWRTEGEPLMIRNFLKPIWLWPLGLLCSAIAFPAMVIVDRTFPRMPDPAKVGWETGSLFHNLKNVSSEMFRADSEWWSKCSCFAALLLAVLLIL